MCCCSTLNTPHWQEIWITKDVKIFKLALLSQSSLLALLGPALTSSIIFRASIVKSSFLQNSASSSARLLQPHLQIQYGRHSIPYFIAQFNCKKLQVPEKLYQLQQNSSLSSRGEILTLMILTQSLNCIMVHKVILSKGFINWSSLLSR